MIMTRSYPTHLRGFRPIRPLWIVVGVQVQQHTLNGICLFLLKSENASCAFLLMNPKSDAGTSSTRLTSLKIAIQCSAKVRAAWAQDTGVGSPFFSVALDSTIGVVASLQQTVQFVSNNHQIWGGTWYSHSCCFSTNALLGVLCFSSSSATG
jgi:hypothetical protein